MVTIANNNRRNFRVLDRGVPWALILFCILATAVRYYSMRIEVPSLVGDEPYRRKKPSSYYDEQRQVVIGNNVSSIKASYGSATIYQRGNNISVPIPRKEDVEYKVANVTDTSSDRLTKSNASPASSNKHSSVTHNEDESSNDRLTKSNAASKKHSSATHNDNDDDDDETSDDTTTYLPTSSPTTYAPTTEGYEPEIELYISSNASSLGEVAKEYISVTLDWWSNKVDAWGNSSVINANLNHPNLLVLAKGLSPYFLRIGGSQADEIIYNVPHHSNSSITDNLNTECKKHPQKCLTVERWDEVLAFANKTGARILFDIAYVRHTRDSNNTNDQREWDSSNARQLLEYTAKSPYANVLYGLELGNELRHKGKTKNITRIALAYKELGQIVNEIWSTEESKHHNKPLIVGPASTGVNETTKLIEAISPYIQIASYHKYHGSGKDPDLHAKYWHPIHLYKPGEAVKKYMSSNNSQLWIGEGAMAHNSGRRNVTDVFQSSMWFANLLGSLSKTTPITHSVYCRQALLGGYYELIDHETLVPNPDYWLSYIWKKLTGTKAIGPILSPQRKDSLDLASSYTFGCCDEPGSDKILIHSFCGKSPGSVVFVVINKSSSRAFNLNVTMGEKRTEYLLTSNEYGLKSKEMYLNGIMMTIENGSLLDIYQLGVHRRLDEQFHIPPISIAFIVLYDSGVEVCA